MPIFLHPFLERSQFMPFDDEEPYVVDLVLKYDIISMIYIFYIFLGLRAQILKLTYFISVTRKLCIFYSL